MNKIIQLSTNGEVEVKDGRKFTRLIGGFGEDKPAITTKQISELVGYDNSVVNRTINRNIKHFTEGIDIIDLKSAMPEWQSDIGYTKNAYNASKNVYMLSQAGFLLYLKFAEGDQAVEIYKNFIEDYFQTKAENIVMKKTLQEQIQELKEQKARLYGLAIVENDELKKFQLLSEVESLNTSIIKLEKSLTQEEVINQLQPKIHIADTITDTKSSYDIGILAKILNIKGMGRNKLFEWMRDNEILMKNNIPYQTHMKYFKVVPVVKGDHTNNKTLIRAEGVEYVVKRLIDDNKIVTKSIDEILAELECVKEVDVA